jgi:hypothetical protein
LWITQTGRFLGFSTTDTESYGTVTGASVGLWFRAPSSYPLVGLLCVSQRGARKTNQPRSQSPGEPEKLWRAAGLGFAVGRPSQAVDGLGRPSYRYAFSCQQSNHTSPRYSGTFALRCSISWCDSPRYASNRRSSLLTVPPLRSHARTRNSL